MFYQQCGRTKTTESANLGWSSIEANFGLVLMGKLRRAIMIFMF